MDAKVTINLAGLDAAREAIRSAMLGDANALGAQHIHNAFIQWAVRYRGAMQDRFDLLSKGGGTWAPLAPSTIAARMRRPLARLRKSYAAGEIDEKTFIKRYKAAKARIRRAKQKARPVGMYGRRRSITSILRDTGTLFNTLSPTLGMAGQYQQRIPFGIRVGIGGSAKHPSGRATIAEIAGFHQFGGGHLPKREILVEPFESTRVAMTRDMERALVRMFRDISRGDHNG